MNCYSNEKQMLEILEKSIKNKQEYVITHDNFNRCRG